jgi:A/G-specific adenine glycosylase
MTNDYSNTIDYLLDWYDLNARILPWRENPNPYFVWISEIMLQQTRVEAVKFYFERFISTLPSIKDLAEVDEEKLMKLWEGLGYYNRARNLQKAAMVIMLEYNGIMPADYEVLLTLPGVGTYTAGAIASIAFSIPRPAVDGNVLRVMKRVSGSFDDITKAKVKKDLEEDLFEIMPKERPGDFNQAIMELGATVCIPNGKPLCDQCPIMHLCKAHQKGTINLIPVKPAKKARKIEKKTILLIEMNGEYIIQKRESKGLLAGLWELPNLEGHYNILGLEDKLRSDDLEQFTIHSLGEAKHIFTHVEWQMVGYHIIINKNEVELDDVNHNEMVTESQNYSNFEFIDKKIGKPYLWVSKETLDQDYTIPTAFEAYRKYII